MILIHIYGNLDKNILDEDRDLLLVCQQLMAQSGEITIVLIDGKATVKRLEWGSEFCLFNSEFANRGLLLTETLQFRVGRQYAKERIEAF